MNNNPSRKQILKQLEGCEMTNKNITNEITELQERLGQLQQTWQGEKKKIRSGYESRQEEILNRISELTAILGEALNKYSEDPSVDVQSFGKLVNQGYKYGCVREMNHFKKIYKNTHKKHTRKSKK